MRTCAATYLLDTNVISTLALRRPIPRILEWLEEVEETIAIPVCAIIEIQRGISFLRPHNPAKATMLADWLEKILRSNAQILPMDAETARLVGVMTTVPSLRPLWIPGTNTKQPKLGQDIYIAAAAIANGCCIATMNIRDFLRIHHHFPLVGLFDPLNAQWHVQLEFANASSLKTPISHASGSTLSKAFPSV